METRDLQITLGIQPIIPGLYLDKLKKGEKIYNVSYDRFLELTIDDIEIEETPCADGNNYTYIYITTTDKRNIFINSKYKCTLDTYYSSLEEALNKVNEYIDYHTSQIEKHNKDIEKLEIMKKK